ncbi:Uncharacterised protein [Mycobacteroides abscessus subsp. abscessus]|nr:Uncharacterised protein [Mycobacteroides abscessus subsp. abscessus]
MRDAVEHHLPAGKTLGTGLDQSERLFWLQVHQQPLRGDEGATGSVDLIHPTEIERGLCQLDDSFIVGQQLVA